MMRVFSFIALLCLPLLAAAQPLLDLHVRLDPATRQFEARATLNDSRGLSHLTLGPAFEIVELKADGRRIAITPDKSTRLRRIALSSGTRQVELHYRATLAAPAPLDHRGVLTDRAPTASSEGSFLPAASGWYPDPGTLFAYRVALELPPGQKGLVAGTLSQETDGPQGYRAHFDFPHPAEGIDLMAGPYVVAQRALTLPGGRHIALRTWFHPDLALLAEGYLDDSARYLLRYAKRIGDYPFDGFSIVSSPTPTGFGMPGLTYLGREVLRLPFIRATSLGHEILHNWWGNGIYPDWARGNWSEGLTTFLADYAYKEDPDLGGGEAAARAMRLGWLRNLAAVPPGGDGALKDFTSRHHGISSIVGYDKAAMVFLMLRDEIGAEAFDAGLRRFWETRRFQIAGWSELEAAFSAAAGRPLKAFFRQWVDRPGAPRLKLTSATRQGERLIVGIEQSGGHALALPLRLVFADRSETRVVKLDGRERAITLDKATGVQRVELDPDYRLWRRVDTAVLPPILREVFVAPQAALVVPEGDTALRAAARALAGRSLDASPASIDDGAHGLPATPIFIVGTPAAIDAWLARHGLPPRPAALKTSTGSAQVWAGRQERKGGTTGSNTPYVVIAARDAAAIEALARPLPHYGGQSWLAFDDAKAVDKGLLPPGAEAVSVR
jgi:aminopeptidase N